MNEHYYQHWSLDPAIVFLNHGSFGACPKAILDKQQEYRMQMESEPIRFMMTLAEKLLRISREKVSRFLHADPADLVFVQNATSGVNTVFRSLDFSPGDEILFTNHIYGACRKTLEYIRFRTGVTLTEAVIPFPLSSPGQIIEAVMARVTPRTRIALIDHITAATALIQPVEELVRLLQERGIDTMIDGAHAPGSIPVSLDTLGAAYYTANCHKWLCAPKGSAILHVRKDKQKNIYPLTISHAGYDAESFEERFFWPGTWDPSAFISVGDAIDYMEALIPGGWPAIRERNHRVCIEARQQICDALEIPLPCPDEMIACLASVPMPASVIDVPHNYKSFSSLQETLFERFHIEIPVWNWSIPPSALLRIAVQLYNEPEQYRHLVTALQQIRQS